MASSSSIKAGSAFVEFFLDDGKLQRGLKKTEAKLRQAGARIQNAGATMLAGGLAGLTAVAFPFKKFAEFDDAIRAVGAVSRASDSDLKMLENAAANLGRTTSFTAVEVAGLMAELGRAGFNPKQIENMTAAVLDLSRATGTDAALSAGIMSATIRQFNLEATDAARVANVLTVAANSTFNTVEGLGDSLAYAGPVAADLGMSLEDTVAILGTLGNVGVQGSAAGTAIRRLATVSAAEAEKMSKIFGVAFTDTVGNARPLVDVLGDVGTATENLPTAERANKFKEAFGLLGITAASTIANAAGSTKELADALKAVSTEAADAAVEMDGGAGGGIRRMASAFEGFQIAFGNAMNTAGVSGFIENITALLGKVTTFTAANPALVESLLLVLATLTAVGAVLVTVGAALKVAAIATGLLSTAFAVMSATGITSMLTIITSQLGAMGIAAGLAKAGMVGLAAYGIYRIAKAIYSANPAIKALNAELKLMNELSGKNNARISKKQSKTLAVADTLKGEERAAFLQEQLNRAEKELAGKKASLKGQTKIVGELDTTFNSMTGNKVLASEQQVLAEIEVERDAAAAFVEQLQDALDETELNAEVETTQTEPEMPADPFAGFDDPFGFVTDADALSNAGLNAAGGIGGGLFGASVDALIADAPPAAPPTPDEETIKLVSDAGMLAGFGAIGGLAGVIGGIASDDESQDAIKKVMDDKAAGAESVAAANNAVDVRSADGQKEVIAALFGFNRKSETTSAIEDLTATVIEEEEKNRRDAKADPRLRVSKT